MGGGCSRRQRRRDERWRLVVPGIVFETAARSPTPFYQYYRKHPPPRHRPPGPFSTEARLCSSRSRTNGPPGSPRSTCHRRTPRRPRGIPGGGSRGSGLRRATTRRAYPACGAIAWRWRRRQRGRVCFRWRASRDRIVPRIFVGHRCHHYLFGSWRVHRPKVDPIAEEIVPIRTKAEAMPFAPPLWAMPMPSAMSGSHAASVAVPHH
mmetsp:Transcript_30525/g.64460  ORF Transcript_30525/g.64460 Transcript_30525/m.64460 type:complete len:207 (+) Transcript_30525:1125-1745(+)